MNDKNTILVVDDSEDSLIIINRILKKRGFNVLNASSGKEGIHLVLKHMPDCILLDRNMPGMDGIMVCKKLKSIDEVKRIPVILWTGANAKEDIIEGLNAGADDFVNKSTDHDILHVRIQAMLRMKCLNDEIQKELEYTKSLVNFSKNINITQMDEIASAMNENLRKVFGLETFSLFVYEQNFDFFRLAAHNQKELKEKEVIVERGQESIMWDALSSKKPIIIKEFHNSKYYSGKTLHRDDFAVSFPLIINKQVIGILNMNNSKDGEFPSGLIQKGTIAVDHLASSISNARIYHKLEELSITDELTQLYNRRLLNIELDEEFHRSKRYKRNFACFMIDIDHFKKINDTYGHPFGDTILMELSLIFKKMVRESDKIFRYGGEEFFVILPEAQKEDGVILAQRIRKEVKDQVFYYKDEPVSLTISIGVVFFPDDGKNEVLDIINIVDKRLYKAKQSGRDRVIFSDNKS